MESPHKDSETSVYMCVYVCMHVYVCMYVCIYVCVYVCVCVFWGVPANFCFVLFFYNHRQSSDIESNEVWEPVSEKPYTEGHDDNI